MKRTPTEIPPRICMVGTLIIQTGLDESEEGIGRTAADEIGFVMSGVGIIVRVVNVEAVSNIMDVENPLLVVALKNAIVPIMSDQLKKTHLSASPDVGSTAACLKVAAEVFVEVTGSEVVLLTYE